MRIKDESRSAYVRKAQALVGGTLGGIDIINPLLTEGYELELRLRPGQIAEESDKLVFLFTILMKATDFAKPGAMTVAHAKLLHEASSTAVMMRPRSQDVGEFARQSMTLLGVVKTASVKSNLVSVCIKVTDEPGNPDAVSDFASKSLQFESSDVSSVAPQLKPVFKRTFALHSHKDVMAMPKEGALALFSRFETVATSVGSGDDASSFALLGQRLALSNPCTLR